MKLRVILVILLISLGVTGCSSVDVKSNLEVLYQNEVNTVVDIREYSQLILDILTYREFDEDGKYIVQQKYKDAVSQSAFRQLETVLNNSKIIYPGITTNAYDYTEEKDGEYPVYDSNYDIAYYGDYGEHIDSVIEFNSHDLNNIENVEANKDKIIFKINNKFNGVYYIHAVIRDGMIDHLSILK